MSKVKTYSQDKLREEIIRLQAKENTLEHIKLSFLLEHVQNCLIKVMTVPEFGGFTYMMDNKTIDSVIDKELQEVRLNLKTLVLFSENLKEDGI
jgi:hypothetical protein